MMRLDLKVLVLLKYQALFSSFLPFFFSTSLTSAPQLRLSKALLADIPYGLIVKIDIIPGKAKSILEILTPV